ncbi:hypothetical protein PS6_003159 [Mucor atramentarius]
MKKCTDALQCINKDYEQDYNIDTRSPIVTRGSFKCIKKHNCVQDIISENRGSTVTTVNNTEKAQLMHLFYNYLHLARYEKKEVKETPNSTAAAAVASIDPATGAIKGSIGNINKVLGKYSRATFEINHSKVQQGVVLSANNAVVKFEVLIDSAQILSSKLFVSFCSPEMVKDEFPLAD